MRDPWRAAVVLGYLLVALLLVYPLAAVLGAATPARWATVLGDPRYREALWHSLVVSLLGTAGAVALGLPLAFLTARYRIPGKGAVWTLALLALLSPPFVGAYAWVLLLGQSGALRLALAAVGLPAPTIYGPGGIALVYALQYYPFVYLLTAGALGNLDPALEEAAETLGATGWRKHARLTLPLVLPAATSGALMAFVMALANFGTPMILGWRDGYRVLPTLAYDLFTSDVRRDPGLAAAVCGLLVLCSAGALGLQRWVAGRRPTATSLLRRPRLRALPPLRQALATATCWGIVGLSTVPLLAIAVTSLRRTDPRGLVFQPGLGLDSYRAALHGAPRAIGNSLTYSLLATAAVVAAGALLGYAVARRRGPAVRLLDALLQLPYVIPGTVLGIGLVSAYNALPLEVVGTGGALVVAFFLRKLPFAVRSSAAALAQVDPQVEEAAASLGARPASAFTRVVLPLMAPGVIAGGLLAWIAAMNELSASIVLYTGRTITLPVRIYQAVQDGSYGPAAALATILLAVTAGALWWVRGVLGPGEVEHTG